MSRYRRPDTTGATYFFTLVSYRRQTILCNQPVRDALREARHPCTSKTTTYN